MNDTGRVQSIGHAKYCIIVSTSPSPMSIIVPLSMVLQSGFQASTGRVSYQDLPCPSLKKDPQQ